MSFAKRRLFLWLTKRQPGLFPSGPPYSIFEQETHKLMIMASSHGSASRITGHPWGESTGHRWTTSQGASNVRHDPWKSCWQTIELYMIWDPAILMSRYCNGAWPGLMWPILWLDSYLNIAWHQFIISCGQYIYCQGGRIHFRLRIHFQWIA